jgi:hypothetical protein
MKGVIPLLFMLQNKIFAIMNIIIKVVAISHSRLSLTSKKTNSKFPFPCFQKNLNLHYTALKMLTITLQMC